MVALSLCYVAPRRALGAWKRHVIDGTSQGADGVRLHDVNGDGLMDIATGWEEGGVIRAYLNPGPAKATEPWPRVTVGKVGSPEDAVFVDLDRDGAVDVVSSCEGKVRTMFVHWAPRDRTRYRESSAWKTEPIPITRDWQMWMFCLPMQADGLHGPDLIIGSKGDKATVGLLVAPADARQLASYKYQVLYKAGWIMSLVPYDMDADGDLDVVVSDRKGPARGVLWLENPGPQGVQNGKLWTEHRIFATSTEPMFLDVVDVDGDGRVDVVVSLKRNHIMLLKQPDDPSQPWQRFAIDMPDVAGSAKAVRAADLDKDGRIDLVFTCEDAARGKLGVMWMTYGQAVTDRQWTSHDISGPAGVKFDLIQLLDMDGDGDLDVITCEERENLGVIWYENPTR